MERQKFEDSWKDAFKDAEVSPSENLWTNIELDLERAEGKVMKKRVLFFKLLAAASVLFAMTFAGIGYYYINTNQSSTGIASNNNNTNQSEVTSATADQSVNKNQDQKEEKSSDSQSQKMSSTSDEGIASAEDRGNKENAAVNADEASQANSGSELNNKNQLASADKGQRSNGKTTSADNSSSVNKATVLADNAAANKSRATKSTSGNKVNEEGNNNSSVNSETSAQSTIAANTINPSAKNQTADRVVENSGTTSPASRVAAGNDNGSTGLNSQLVNRASTAASEDALAKSSTRLPVLAQVTIPKTVATQAPQFSSEADPVKVMMERLKEEEARIAAANSDKKEKQKGRRDESIWTSVGFSAGAFNTYTSGSPSAPVARAETLNNTSSFLTAQDAPLSNEAQVVKNQTSASGNAYSVGLSLGGKISSRWVIQGGVNYLTQNSNYLSNAVVVSSSQDFKAASLNEVDKVKSSGKSDTRLLNTANYNVNSSVVYMSVPLQAGYMVINRNFGLQLNAGVSTDLFVRNTLTPDQGTLEKTTQGNGADSPYRPLNFSGLAGTELSYRFSRHYRIALNPGVRYPFSSIYKSNVEVNAMPLTFDVGMKFRYIFH